MDENSRVYILRLEMAPQQNEPGHEMEQEMQRFMDYKKKVEDAQTSASPPRLDTPPVEDVCDVEKGLSPPSERLKELLNQSLANFEKYFEIGSASPEGNNCLLHSLYQLFYNKKRVDEKEEATVNEWRDLLVAAKVEERGEMLDVTGEAGKTLAASLHIRIQPIEITKENNVHLHPVVGTEGKLVYVLHTGGNHFNPLFPKDSLLKLLETDKSPETVLSTASEEPEKPKKCVEGGSDTDTEDDEEPASVKESTHQFG